MVSKVHDFELEVQGTWLREYRYIVSRVRVHSLESMGT